MKLTEAFKLPFTQSEVDFVVPNITVDLNVAIDPFLLFKSRDPYLQNLHGQLVSIFNQGIQAFREGRREDLDRLIDFPEVDEIGFGYSLGAIRGRGLGNELNHLLAETLVASPALQERGVRHVEEMQLVSIGVGEDRVSDIAGNVLKLALIQYTQEQAAIWDIPIEPGVPVEHYFDFEAWDWADGYFDLPRNPHSGLPILLVPRRIVRLLPFINYSDYARTDYRAHLKARKRRESADARLTREDILKNTVVGVTRHELNVLDGYIDRKERERDLAEPMLRDEPTPNVLETVGGKLIARLQTLPTGTQTASEYQRLVYEIINYLFEPDLTVGKMESATHHGTERRDIIYINEASTRFLEFVRNQYKSYLLLFELKNVKHFDLDYIYQTAAYLGTSLGMLGFVVTRTHPGENILLKTYSVFNKTIGDLKKVILILTDEDLTKMIGDKQSGRDPVDHLRSIYVRFMEAIQ